MSPAHPELGNSKGSSTGHGHFLPREDQPRARLDIPLSVCSAQLDSLSLPSELSLELFACHQQFVETTVSGEERAEGTRMLGWGPAAPGVASLGSCLRPAPDLQPLSDSPCGALSRPWDH